MNRVVPKNLPEALAGTSEERKKWLNALHKELKSCIKRGVFKQANIDQRAQSNLKPLKSKIHLDIKSNGTYKCRWVACGYNQRYGSDYNETFSPTAQTKSIYTLLHIAGVKNLEIYTLDVGNAYLESELDIPLLMRPPKDLIEVLDLDPEIILEIKKGLYGLKQSGRLWYDHIVKILHKFNFVSSLYDPCIFIYTKTKLIDGLEQNYYLYLALYVDDLLVVGENLADMDEFVDFLRKELNEVKVNKNTDISFEYLGLTIKRNRKDKLIRISQFEYIKSVLVTYLPRDATTSTYPLDPLFLNRISEITEKTILEPIYDLLGSLRFIADRSRPDLLFTVNTLSRYMHAPSPEVLTEAIRTMKYLKETIEYELVFGGNDIFLYAMTDASFIHTGDCRSQSGYIIFLGIKSGAISTYSHKAESVALSSTQSETDALVEGIKEITWFHGFIESLNIGLPKPTLILVDNKPLEILSKDGNHIKKSKHFIIKTAYIKEEQQLGNIYVEHIEGIHNTADITTKGLQGSLLYKHTAGILGHYLVFDLFHEDPELTLIEESEE